METLQEEPAIYFLGSNIYPLAEYQERYTATEKITRKHGLRLIKEPYNYQDWLGYVKSKLPEEPASYSENGLRCQKCFTYRLKKTAFYAKENGYQDFATTLSVSSHKDVKFINGCGQELADHLKLNYLAFQLDPHEAHRRGKELSKELGVYRQKYCGCEFSLPKGERPAPADR